MDDSVGEHSSAGYHQSVMTWKEQQTVSVNMNLENRRVIPLLLLTSECGDDRIEHIGES